jgi:hypothetical protein
MEGFVKAVTKLLEVIERMSGGKKIARVVFWVAFITIIAVAAKPAWDSVSYVYSKMGSIVTSPVAVAIASLVILVVGFASLFAVLTLVAVIPAQFIRTMLDSAFRVRLNDTLVASIDILKRAEQAQPDNPILHQLVSDTQFLHSKYISTKTNIFVSWIVPSYFKKDSSKWKLVKVENLEDKNKKRGKTK